MSSFHYEGKKIYYEEIGNGKPLLLLHGNTACGKCLHQSCQCFLKSTM